MSNDEQSLLPDRTSPLARVGEQSRQITRGIDRLRQTERRFIALPTPSGASSEARAINNRGQIVGRVGVANGFAYIDSRAVLWERGRMEYLETRPGWLSNAYDINDAGQVVGIEHRGEYAEVSERDGAEAPRPILWDKGQRIELERFSNGCAGANAINNRGQIVGWADIPAAVRPPHWTAGSSWRGGVQIGETRAVLWEDAVAIELETLYAGSDASDQAHRINNYGVIVGSSHGRAARWHDGHVTALEFDLTGDVNYSGVWDINDQEQVVAGVSGYDPESNLTFLWQAGHLVDLGQVAYAVSASSGIVSPDLRINGRGQIVGLQCTANSNRASVWEDGCRAELSAPTAGATFAADINDHGQVVGGYEEPEVTWRACLWQ